MVKLDTGQRRLNLRAVGTMSTSAILRVLEEQNADPSPSCSASDIHGRAVLRVVDTVRRESEHGGFAIEIAGCNEEGLPLPMAVT